MARRPDGGGLVLQELFSRELVDLFDGVDLVAEELHPQEVVAVGREDVDDVAAHAEAAALGVEVVAVVLDLYELMDEVVAVEGDVSVQEDGHVHVVFWAADAVDAADGGHHDDVFAGEQRRRCRMAELFDLFVDGGVLLYEGVCLRDVGLWLVVVVVADEVDHRVVWEELLELAAQLGGEGLVGRHDQGGHLAALDDVGHGEGLARACDA